MQARTPINVFALAMMACAAILGASATQVTGCDARTAFTYTIHAFLAVAVMFFVTLLFYRKGIYHPLDLVNVKDVGKDKKDLNKDRPEVAAVIICLMLIGYATYQFNRPDPCPSPMQTNITKAPADAERQSEEN
ncbi:MAG: hypothetical protein HPY30_03145 [Gammaproteobacteria bacterium (ex Lamellibrachia satsuma)]|nr:MAG: hypothetical protein HPY30_03145 [Gammaproteobacteria bacterium (ex Lamellibrachia satsuma)]